MKYFFIVIVSILLLFPSCSTNKKDNEEYSFDRREERFFDPRNEMNFGQFNTLGDEIGFSSTLDCEEYSKSVDSYVIENREKCSILDLSKIEVLDNEYYKTKIDDGSVSIEIKKPVELELTGLSDKAITIKSDYDYTLIFNSVELASINNPPLTLKGDGLIDLVLKGTSIISDTIENEKKGAIVSKTNIVISGDGSLLVEGNKKHGIKSDGYLRIISGNLEVRVNTEAEGNALSIDRAYIQDGGNVTIYALGSVYGEESKGLKVNGLEEENAMGQIIINGGSLYVESVGKAMTAGWKISEDATTETIEDDPSPDLIINGGVVRVKTTGTPYEVSDEESLSPEGLEAKGSLIINGGIIEVEATDDGLNAGKEVIINGGYVYSYSRAADAIDSNGELIINGGVVVALGGFVPETGLDCDYDTSFTFTGGTVVSFGGANNNVPRNEKTTSYSLSFSSSSSFAILNGDNTLLSFSLPSGYSGKTCVEVLSSSFVEGEEYKVVSAKDIVSNSSFNGLSFDSSFTTISEIGTYTISGFVNGDVFSFMNMGFNGGGMMMPQNAMPMPEGMMPPEMPQSSMSMPEGMTPPGGMNPPEMPQGRR